MQSFQIRVYSKIIPKVSANWRVKIQLEALKKIKDIV